MSDQGQLGVDSGKASAEADVAPKGSYEELRAANIKRNEEIMRALGLDKSDFILHEAHNKAAKSKDAGKAAAKAAGKKRKSEEEAVEPTVGTRRSLRQRGVTTEDTKQNFVDLDGEIQPRHRSPTLNPLVASREVHEREEQDYLRWAGKQKPATIVGTASYKHTLHRVRSMTEKALQNRIKAIERACGQHAVVKMKLFARVLCLEGLDDLSAEATEAYQRLARKLGEPDDAAADDAAADGDD